MGIEPTWDLVEPHAGFEDQERHQNALRLRYENGTCLGFGANRSWLTFDYDDVKWRRIRPEAQELLWMLVFINRGLCGFHGQELQ